MSRTFDIPGGQATFRERDDLTNGQVKAIRRALTPVGAAAMRLREAGRRPGESDEQFEARLHDSVRRLDESVEQYAARMGGVADHFTPDFIELMAAMAEAEERAGEVAIVNTLIGWTLPDPLPTLETIDDVRRPIFDALVLAIGKMGGAMALTMPENFEPTPDADSPFVGSPGSDGHSKASAASRSTTKSPAGGRNTATASATT